MMSAEVEISIAGAAGIITLDRPRAINALSADMIQIIDDALVLWARDKNVRAVVIEGRGERGFCAGGDIRATREMVLSGDQAAAFAFFAAEYRMNARISAYEKPIIALQNGIVMGGGVGLSSHARYRVATETSRFAMPEAAIGFFCDVGVNGLLYKTTQARALAFLLSGQTIGAADAMALGLTDCMVSASGLSLLRKRLIDAAGALDVDTAVAGILQSETLDAGPAEFCALADSLDKVFVHSDIGSILEQLEILADEGDPGAAALLHMMAGHCPTSLAVSLLAHRKARQQREIGEILRTDLAIAHFMVARSDFAEGVRAMLVDRDRNPLWFPKSHDEVDLGGLEHLLAK